MERVISLTIDESRDGKRVYELLRRDLRLSAALIKRVKYLERGILLNGARVFVDAVARAGDLLEVMLDEGGASSEGILPVKGELDIVYEDDDLLILNKPAGMPVHPSRGHELDSLANVVMGRYAEMGKPFVFRAVNRLDRGTSGLMAVAKNAHAQERMKKQLGSAAFLRTYLAVCRGAPVPPDGTIDAPIGRRAAPLHRARGGRGGRPRRHALRDAEGVRGPHPSPPAARDRADAPDPGAPEPHRAPPCGGLPLRERGAGVHLPPGPALRRDGACPPPDGQAALLRGAAAGGHPASAGPGIV